MNFPLLFSPLQVGPYLLNHRIVMAPLTRMRAEKESFAPRPLNAEYYGQRATPGGLIIAEASPVMSTGRGNAGTPGSIRIGRSRAGGTSSMRFTRRAA
jgi:N-ethylmaleimide reductase